MVNFHGNRAFRQVARTRITLARTLMRNERLYRMEMDVVRRRAHCLAAISAFGTIHPANAAALLSPMVPLSGQRVVVAIRKD
jgi:hypothetical protein